MNIKLFLVKFIPSKSVRKKIRHAYKLKQYFEQIKARVAMTCDIGDYEGLLAKGAIFPHPTGIVISKYVSVGTNCIFYQNVTIGLKQFPKDRIPTADEYPTLGNDVTVYSGAVLVGPIKIGDNAIIGANAVVMQDVPAGCLAVGAPAKIIRHS